MKTKRRWMSWVLEETAQTTVQLPWDRGARKRRLSRAAA
ncbi:hypothetical protein Ga0609869_000924 [Rhodovulum iodosum]|uniref:Uncharacterized protein n=1 Tax=Rhodovulum iodosum TaxID=68291 RepID=A0ABV3XQG9_9RHOB